MSNPFDPAAMAQTTPLGLCGPSASRCPSPAASPPVPACASRGLVLSVSLDVSRAGGETAKLLVVGVHLPTRLERLRRRYFEAIIGEFSAAYDGLLVLLTMRSPTHAINIA